MVCMDSDLGFISEFLIGSGRNLLLSVWFACLILNAFVAAAAAVKENRN